MLVIASDIHLGDGTCTKSISPSAFYLFVDRLREAAYHASWRKDNRYKPVEIIDLVFMGDVLDPIHSTRWLDTKHGDKNYIRPWMDPSLPAYAAKLQEVTRAMLKENTEALEQLRRCAAGEMILLPPADSQGRPAFDAKENIRVPVRIHYTVGNHDWYYHLPGPAFDAIRKEIIDAMGLSNPVNNFPWAIEEYGPVREIFAHYKVYGRHGDCFDKFNYNKEAGRDVGTLGDVFAMEVLNRFPVQAEIELGNEIPSPIIDSLRRLVNVRPALATPLWISSQIRRYSGNEAVEHKLKAIWDKLGEEFLNLDFVRAADKAFQFDAVDALELIVKISKQTSFNTLSDIVVWVRDKMSEGGLSFAKHALNEPCFLDDSARYIVYGHTHHPEVVSLDSNGEIAPFVNSQVYFNSGTWHSYYDLAIKNPEEQKFIPYQALTYLTFYSDGERGGRSFETWSGSFS